MPVKVGINGFGRIGRIVLRASLDSKTMEITTINDLGSAENLAHLLKYDSIYGKFPGEVKYHNENSISVNNREIKFFHKSNPEEIPWGELGVDIVIDATGIFKSGPDLEKHLKGGAKKVILTAPGKDVDITVVMGVNQGEYKPDRHKIISNASCTTNGLAPVAKILNQKFGIE
ncbi:MAG: type I glyceraldehyde-3-phosphate dehydrogenase, partial [Firmicutes bacterium HGW-Firmicutes-13]